MGVKSPKQGVLPWSDRLWHSQLLIYLSQPHLCAKKSPGLISISAKTGTRFLLSPAKGFHRDSSFRGGVWDATKSFGSRLLFSGKHTIQLGWVGNLIKPKEMLGICAVFRDEAPRLEEWLRFHSGQGVSRFFLYDDGSVDSPGTVLEPWIRSGAVILSDAPFSDQERTYNLGLKVAKRRVRWLAFIDIDEFLFSPEGKRITWVLKKFEGAAGVIVRWKLFGSSGRETVGPLGVLESFTRSLRLASSLDEQVAQQKIFREIKGNTRLTGQPLQVKSIVNVRRVTRMGIHQPKKIHGYLTTDDGANWATIKKGPQSLLGQSSEANLLRINHYWSQSMSDLREKIAKPPISKRLRESINTPVNIEVAKKWEVELNQESDLAILRQWRKISAPFVFFIGFNKTATRAFHFFFREHGFNCIHWGENRLVDQMVRNLAEKKKIFHGYDEQYRVFSDLTSSSGPTRIEGNQYFREMHRDYPEAFFILNNRPTEEWVQSRARHVEGVLVAREKKATKKSESAVLEQWRNEKRAHEQEVREYFNNNARFREIDISSPKIPEQLSALLGMDFDPKYWTTIGASAGVDPPCSR